MVGADAGRPLVASAMVIIRSSPAHPPTHLHQPRLGLDLLRRPQRTRMAGLRLLPQLLPRTPARAHVLLQARARLLLRPCVGPATQD
jgi:hypothetical protein